MTTANSQLIEFRLHPKQLEIYHDPHRYKLVQAGRRFGKTRLAWTTCLVFMLQNPGCLLWWVAPLYKELIPATKTVRILTPKTWVKKQLENSEIIRYIKLFNGSECFFHYKFTNPTKKALIENLSIMLDNGEITFPGNPETKEFSTALNPDFNVLKTELESFTYDLLPSGLIHYGAPEGLHDDCVVALALAAYMIKQRKFYAPLGAFRIG